MKVISIIIMLVLSGCVAHAPSLPEGYAGDIATIDDSFQRLSRSKANLFYIKSLNGESIYNGLEATEAATYGKGSQLIAMGASRYIPAQPLILYIVGQVYHSAPIGYMFGAGSNYIVEGELDFTPKADEKYRVKGSLSERYSAVWIEDINGNVVSKVIEMKGGAHVVTDTAGSKSEHRVLSREEHFLNLVSGESVSLVKEKIGEPDTVSRYEGNFFTERPPTVTYQYKGLGSILFTSKNSEPQFIERIMPISKQSDDLSLVKMQLNSEGLTLQYLAKSYYQFDELAVEKLDLFAAKVWSSKDTEDPYAIDAISWLCKVLAKSNNPRYKFLLKKVASGAASKKLKKYAMESYQLLPSEDASQFIPAEQ